MYDNCNTIVSKEGAKMLSIRLNKQLEKDLKEVADFEGTSVSDYVRNIIIEKLEDIYDYNSAAAALKSFNKSKKKTYSFDEVFDKWLINSFLAKIARNKLIS